MTELESIWHTAEEIPPEDSYVVVKFTSGKCEVGFEFEYDFDNIEKWAFFDDLLALETELERTRKALDVANEKLRHCVNMTVEELDELKGNLLIAYDALLHFSKDPIANNALKKITTPKQRIKNEKHQQI